MFYSYRRSYWPLIVLNTVGRNYNSACSAQDNCSCVENCTVQVGTYVVMYWTTCVAFSPTAQQLTATANFEQTSSYLLTWKEREEGKE